MTLIDRTEARVLLETQQWLQLLYPKSLGFPKLSFSFHKDTWDPITCRHPAGQAKSRDDEDSPKEPFFSNMVPKLPCYGSQESELWRSFT